MKGRYLQTDWLCARFSRPTKRRTPQTQGISVKGSLPTNGGLGMNKNIFSPTLKTGQSLVGKAEPLGRKETIIVELVRAMLLEEKSQRRIWTFVWQQAL